MLRVDEIDIHDRKQVDQFIQFQHDLYKGCPQYVPPFWSDMHMVFDPKKHPFYEHSEASFFVVRRDGKIVARVAALESRPYNEYHHKKTMEFYYFDAYEDEEAVKVLFETVFEWGRKRGLDHVIGPKGFSIFDPYGVLVTGFENRAMMTMMNYNYPYYERILQACGFTRENDFVSCDIVIDEFKVPDKVREIARRVEERGIFWVKNFETKKELTSWASRIGETYNKTFINNWEYYPLTKKEVDYVVDTIMTIANPKYIKLIMHQDDIVGFIFGFPDISAALQRHGGRITPWGLVDFLLEMRKAKTISLNGMGVLPEYHGRGGNAMMYVEMEKTVRSANFLRAEATQMADTAIQVRQDMVTLGAKIYKVHRVFGRGI